MSMEDGTMTAVPDPTVESLAHRREPSPEGWLTMALSQARALEASLAQAGRLDTVAAAIAHVANRLDCQMVTGASRVGDQLAGAVVARSAGKLTLWADNGAHGTMLVIEGYLYSGAQTTRMAYRARRAGSDRVVGVAVLAEEAGLSQCRAELGDEVVVLEPMR